MRQVFIAAGILAAGAFLLNYAFQEATEQVMGPGIEQATAEVEGLSAMAEHDAEAVARGRRDFEEASGEVDDWYAESGESDDTLSDEPSEDPPSDELYE